MNRPWMPLYIADYLRDTRHLNAAEHGAYLLLIMQYWTAGCLPDDDVRLARITCMSEADWLRTRPVMLEFFQPGWRHPRIDEELAEAEKISAAGRAGGEASAKRRRRQTPATDQRSSNDQPTIEQRSANDHGNDQPTISQPITITTTVDRIGDARASGGARFTPGSKALADAFWKALGFNSPLEIPPEFAGVDYRAVEWERAGWTVDLVGTEAARLARDRPLKPMSYFEKVFATSFAKRQAPLPIVDVRPAEIITVTGHARTAPGQAGNGNIIQAADRLVDAIDAFDDGPGSDAEKLRGEAGAPVVRLLPQGRRE